MRRYIYIFISSKATKRQLILAHSIKDKNKEKRFKKSYSVVQNWSE